MRIEIKYFLIGYGFGVILTGINAIIYWGFMVR